MNQLFGLQHRGDRYLSHSSHHTQVSVPVTTFLSKEKEKNLAVLQKKRIFAAKKKQTSH